MKKINLFRVFLCLTVLAQTKGYRRETFISRAPNISKSFWSLKNIAILSAHNCFWSVKSINFRKFWKLFKNHQYFIFVCWRKLFWNVFSYLILFSSERSIPGNLKNSQTLGLTPPECWDICTDVGYKYVPFGRQRVKNIVLQNTVFCGFKTQCFRGEVKTQCFGGLKTVFWV